MNQEIIEYSKYIYNLKYPKLLLIIGVLISLFNMKVSSDAWFAVLSTLAQVFGALIALVAMFLLFRIELLENKLTNSYKRLDDVNVIDWIKLKYDTKQYSGSFDEKKEIEYLKLLNDEKKYDEADKTVIISKIYIKNIGYPMGNSVIDEHPVYARLENIIFEIKKIKNHKELLHSIIPKLRRFVYIIIICIVFLSIGSVQISDTQDWLQKIILFLSNYVKLPILGFIIGIAVSELLEFIKTINDMVVNYE